MCKTQKTQKTKKANTPADLDLPCLQEHCIVANRRIDYPFVIVAREYVNLRWDTHVGSHMVHKLQLKVLAVFRSACEKFLEQNFKFNKLASTF